MANQKFYSVRIDKKNWTKDTVTVEEFEKRGFLVQEARRVGDLDVFWNGRKVAVLFSVKSEAAEFALG